MNLVDFILRLPENWATAPIYAKGQTLPNDKTACGKSPWGRASHVDLAPKTTALKIQENPDTFKAVGVYSGHRSDGLVIFDVDDNLGAILEKWGADLDKAPSIKSPRPHACKYLFSVPEADRLRVADISHASAGHEGWEVLWGRQGVIFGAYPGKNGQYEGEYTFKGDTHNIPEAPEWLLERMREEYRKRNQKDSARTMRDTRYACRSREEKIAIAQSCLSVIEPRGAFSEQFWWEIGAMLHSELPNQDGLKLWEEWSRRDNEYQQDWENGQNPCRDRWEAGFRSGGLGFGSLIREADLVDKDRSRFQRDGLAQLVEEIQAAPAKYKLDLLGPEELIARGLEIEETYDNPAFADQAKTILAQEGGRLREGAAAIDRLLDTHTTYERNRGCKPAAVGELDNTPFEYLIPGWLPKPWLLLIHADGGTGKSAMCQTLCKHISQGIPFNVHGANVPVPKAKCLWLNGDQSERVLRNQFEEKCMSTNVDVMAEWDMQWYRQFCKIQHKNHYALVVIDSLDGCNDSNPYEENRREYAHPLKRLARRNGKDFPACTIIVIHHNNRNGGFRGTSAIKAAVDETWNMVRLDNKQVTELGLSYNSRLVTVEKSRDNREGMRQVFTLKGDFTYAIGPVPEPKEHTATSPEGYKLQLLSEMRANRKAWTAKDFEEHETLGGVHRVRAIKYALSKLADQKLIQRCDPPVDAKFKGRKPNYWQAVGTNVTPKFSARAQGGSVLESVKSHTPSPGTDLNDKPLLSKAPDCQKPGTSDLLTNPDLLTNAIVVKNPSPATPPAFDAEKPIHGDDDDFDNDANIFGDKLPWRR